jgi:SAM-dependent methyltransferase
VAGLPEPFRDEPFERLRLGIFDSPETSVYVNAGGDFVFLDPQPSLDYTRYVPRKQKLGLDSPERKRQRIGRRFAKLRPLLEGAASLVEIGAHDGAFLAAVGEALPGVCLASLEPDQNTRAERDVVPGLEQYEGFPALHASGRCFDRICFFHVLEHILDPVAFLADCRRCLAPGGRLIVEVPSLDDPLLSLYRSSAYQAFYFQRQHPYVYSGASLLRLLEACGLKVDRMLPYQRYGLGNHLAWLTHGKPGGDPTIGELTAASEETYLAALEARGRTDTTIAVAGPGERG